MKNNYKNNYFTHVKTKRKFLVWAFAFISLLSVIGSTQAWAAEPLTVTIDNGTSVTLSDSNSDGYYEISSADELYAFSQLVNAGGEYVGINAQLTNDIVFNENVLNDDGTLHGEGTNLREWAPIGYFCYSSSGIVDIYYQGNFDGCGHTISGLYVNQSTLADSITLAGVALFGQTENATITNVTVADSYFYGKYGNVAAIVGLMHNTKVEHCTASATIQAKSCGGGIVGNAVSRSGVKGENVISHCVNKGKLEGSGSCGGISGGSCDGTITYCENYGRIVCDNIAGGIVASLIGTMDNCTNYGEIYGETKLGGIVGSCLGGIVSYCVNTAKVIGSGQFVGGIVGESGNIWNCQNSGDIVGGNNVGGIAGSSKSIYSSYNTGTVNAPELDGSSTKNCFGGVAGSCSGVIKNCYNIGDLNLRGDYRITDIGGIVGSGRLVNNCYNVGKLVGRLSKRTHAIVGQLSTNGSIANCYYLEGCATDLNNNVIERTVSGATSANSSAFSNGRIAYLLQQYVENNTSANDSVIVIWGQNIDGEGEKESLPALFGKKVYKNQTGGCNSETFQYKFSNTAQEPVTSHQFVDDVCIHCGQSNAVDTGIASVAEQHAEHQNAVYDLTGRRIAHPVKGGVYIINHKKIYIK